MNVRRTLGGVATASLLVTLTACGSGGDKATQASSDAAAPAASTAATPDSGAAAMVGNNAPGTGADAYKKDDPFVAGNVKIPDLPKTIAAAGIAFTKATYTAHPGEVWTFNNADIAKHNVQTDDTDPNFKEPAKFKSPDALPGKKVKFTMPKKKGTYHIVCIYHGSMTATLTIK